MESSINELTEKEFEKFSSGGVVVVDFFAEWCMPCLMMAPVFEEIADKLGHKMKFGKINIDENNSLSNKFKIGSVPTVVVLKDGKEVHRIIGSYNPDDLEKSLNDIHKA
jgi:thioredoxin 1